MKVQTVLSTHFLCTLILIAAVSNTAAVTDTINANRAFSASLIGISPSSTSLYYTPLTDDSGEDDENPFSEDFVSGLEQFFAGVENSKFIPWLILTSANVHLSMDDDPTKALSSFSSSGSSSTAGGASLDRVHSLCDHDVQSLCSFSNNLRSSKNSLSNTLSLGYSCKRIETCLWNAFEQRILSQPCGQAILDLTMTPLETPLMRSTDTHRTSSITAPAEPFSLTLLQSILLWLQAHALFQKILSMTLSVLVIYLAFFPCHYHRHRFLAHHHSWRIKKQILQAIQQDSELFQHVQRVVGDGESIHRSDLHVSPCPTRNRRRHRFTLVYRVATCIVPKTTLMALILFLAWSTPIFMIVFLGFHVMIMAVLYLIAMLSEWITVEEGSNVERRGSEDETTDLNRPLLANGVQDESSGRSNTAAFVGVPLKIV